METVAGMNTTTTSSSSTPDWTISTFSLSEWRKTRDSTHLLELCHGVGFFYVTDHGIPNEFFDKHFQLVRDFFRLPDSSKALIEKLLT
jgi:isopenicillin N synthase-like dioxygenase